VDLSELSGAVPSQVTALYAPFLDACARHELVLPRCAGCGRLHWYLPPVCSTCLGAEFGWTPSAGRGSVYSFTVVRHPFVDRVPVPAVVGVIELDDRPGLLMIGRIVHDPRDVRIGARVVVAWPAAGSAGPPLPVFALDPALDSALDSATSRRTPA
jgi:uncharacterized OB-fold protein